MVERNDADIREADRGSAIVRINDKADAEDIWKGSQRNCRQSEETIRAVFRHQQPSTNMYA